MPAQRSSERAMLFFNQWQDDIANRVAVYRTAAFFWNMGLKAVIHWSCGQFILKA